MLAGLAAAMPVPGAWEAQRLVAAAASHGPQAVEGARALQQLLDRSAALDEAQRLVEVNRFFNRRVSFRDDAIVWGAADYWASPLEMLAKAAGDCEDFTIAKYFTLLGMGVPAAKLRLVYVRALIGGPGGVPQAHMVLAYYAAPGAEPTILDNLIDELRPSSRRPDLVPVFSFNTEGLWKGVGADSAGDPVARLSRWREVLRKVRDEGLL
jgi:predicted transglutaminase-like cysteine proteinase